MKNDKTKHLKILSVLSALLLLTPMVSGASVDAGLSASALIGADVDYNSSTSVETGSTSKTEVETTSDTNLKLNASGVAITSSAQVSSDADLEVFSENIVAEKDNVVKVKMNSEGDSESKIIVKYKHHGKLVGFIPVTVQSTTEVSAKADEELEVKSRLPWWSFLVTKKNYDKFEIESELRNNAVIRENVQAGASASARARVTEEVIAVVQANAMANVAVNN